MNSKPPHPRDKLLDRVRKLLALATSPNVHEAASAAARAQALVDEHRLQAWLDAARAHAEDADPITDARDCPLEVARRLRTWKVVLAVALADANGCFAYTLARDADEAIVLVGRERDRAVVVELWQWLVQRIEWLSATLGAGQPRKWHDAFRIGVVDAVAKRLRAQGAAGVADLAPAALTVLEPAMAAHREALAAFVAQRLRLGKGRGLRVDARAYAQGRTASATLDLPKRSKPSTPTKP